MDTFTDIMKKISSTWDEIAGELYLDYSGYNDDKGNHQIDTAIAEIIEHDILSFVKKFISSKFSDESDLHTSLDIFKFSRAEILNNLERILFIKYGLVTVDPGSYQTISLADAREILNYFITTKCIKSGDPNEGKYEYISEQYITKDELVEKFFEFAKDLEENKQEPAFKDLWTYIDNSGLMKFALDEYHCPLLANTGMKEEELNILKFCIGVFNMQEKKSVVDEDIEDLINRNINNFAPLDEKIYERVKITKNTINEISKYLKYFLGE